MTEENITVSSLTLDNGKEYAIIDKIAYNDLIYLFLAGEQEICVRKYSKEKKDGEIFPLDNLEELNNAFQLFFQKHPELKENIA